MKTKTGFTLIEVLVVVVILSILAAFAVPKIMDRPDQTRIVAAQNDIRTIMTSLKLYRLDNGVYPTTEEGLAVLESKTGGYIEMLPKDPWGNNYFYLNPGIHGEVDVYTLGADQVPGGEGVNEDLGSWSSD